MTPETLHAENARLRRTLAALRLRYANLLAAARATLAAAHDGEAEPLAYLADELTDHGQLPPGRPASPAVEADRLAYWLHVYDDPTDTDDLRGDR
jgi:hypothetical protein